MTSSNDGGERAEKFLGGELSDDEFLKKVEASRVKEEDGDDVPAAQPDAEDAQPISPGRSIQLTGPVDMEDVSDGASLVGLDAEDETSSVGNEASSSVSTADTLPPYPPITYFPKQVVPEPMCCKCGQRVDPFNTRLVKKVTEPAAFKCQFCNTKHVQLCGIFGHWPVKEFQEQSPEEQQKFWAEKTKGKKEVEDSVMKHIVRTHMERLVAKDDGDYLPIGVYTARGFEPDLILKHCKDKVFEEDKGWCYKVRIHGDSKHTIDELADKKMLDMKNRGRKRKAPQDAGGNKRRRRNDDNDDDDADSDSAEDDDGGNKRRRRNNDDDDDAAEVKETAAEAKARNQEEKKAEAAHKKAEKERAALSKKKRRRRCKQIKRQSKRQRKRLWRR